MPDPVIPACGESMMPINWNEVVQNPDFFMFPMFATFCLTALGTIIAVQCRKASQAKYDTYLKQQLVERGFKADDIVRIVEAGKTRHWFMKSPKRDAFIGSAACC